MSKRKLGDLFIDFEDDIIEDETGNHTLVSRTGLTSSTDSVFGDASVEATLNDGFIMSNSTAFRLHNNKFTIDFWIKPLLSYDTWTGTFQLRPSSSPIYDLSAAIHNGDKRLKFWSRNANNYVCLMSTTDNSITWDEWNHIAIVRYGNGANELKIFINGIEQVLSIDVPLAYNASFPNFTTAMRFCTTPSVGSLIGRMDNFRWNRGEALWTDDFDLTESDLFYESSVKMPISNVYNISSTKGNLRGKAAAGYIRPTIKQFFTSENFEEIGNKIQANDDFSGDVINTRRWEVSNPAPTQNDGINFDINQRSYTLKYIFSKFKFIGDYDIQVDFSGWSLAPTTNTFHAVLGVGEDVEAINNRLFISRSYHESRSMYYSGLLQNGTWRTPLYKNNTSSSEGKLRITNIDGNITTYYFQSNSWVQLGTYTNVTIPEHRVIIYSTNPVNEPVGTSTFSNFIVNSGEYVEL